LIDDDTFVLAGTADTCFMVHLVYLFMKTHLLALLQDKLSWLGSLCFLAQFVWMREECNSILSTPTATNEIGHFGRYWYYLWNPNIGPIYQSISSCVMHYCNVSLQNCHMFQT